jgi:hypothetical protein
MIRFFKAFSSEVDSGSLEENASKQETEAFDDPIPPDRNGKGFGAQAGNPPTPNG